MLESPLLSPSPSPKVNKILLSRNQHPLTSPKNKNTKLPTPIHFLDSHLKTHSNSRKARAPLSQENKRVDQQLMKGASNKKLDSLAEINDPERELQMYKIKASRSPKGIKDILNNQQWTKHEEEERKKDKWTQEENVCQFTFGN